MILRTIDDQYPSMPWDKLDSIAFDAGNVLVSFDPESILRRLVPDHPELYPRLRQKVFASPYWDMMDLGVFEEPEAAKAMIGRDEELRPYIESILGGWMHLAELVPEGISALQAARAHGKKTFILSNYPGSSFDAAMKKFPILEQMDGRIVSARERLAKPNPAIFRLLIERFDLVPERTLFIDDTHIHVASAMSVGLQGFCLNAPGKLARFLQE